MTEVKPGRYRHYKGGEYIVLGTARHSETEEMLVVYRPEYGGKIMGAAPGNVLGDSRDARWP